MTSKNKNLKSFTSPGKPAKRATLANSHPSTRVHTARTRIKSSRRARSQNFSRTTHRTARHTILSIIVLTGMIVVLTALFATFSTTENFIKSNISAIATDYYENYFYDNILANNNGEKPISEILEFYTKPGFSTVTLRQLLLYDDERNADSAAFLTSHCDENSTTIHIFPDPPYDKTNYHIDYHYSCNFE